MPLTQKTPPSVGFFGCGGMGRFNYEIQKILFFKIAKNARKIINKSTEC